MCNGNLAKAIRHHFCCVSICHLVNRSYEVNQLWVDNGATRLCGVGGRADQVRSVRSCFPRQFTEPQRSRMHCERWPTITDRNRQAMQ